MIKLPVHVGSGGYLSEPNDPMKYIVDGDHYCQSYIRISIDPTLAGTIPAPKNVNLFLRMTLSLKGGVRAKADPNIGPDPSESTAQSIVTQVKCGLMTDVWEVPINDAFLRAKIRLHGPNEIVIHPLVQERTRYYSWEPYSNPNQPNLKVQHIIEEHDLYFWIPETSPSNYIIRLPTEPGKGRSICSDYFLMALPKPAPLDFPLRSNLLGALRNAGLYRLSEDQLLKFAHYVAFDWNDRMLLPPHSAELYSALETHLNSFERDDMIEMALAALSVLRAASLEHTPVLAIAAHVKELRKSKDSERRYTSVAKIVELSVQDIS